MRRALQLASKQIVHQATAAHQTPISINANQRVLPTTTSSDQHRFKSLLASQCHRQLTTGPVLFKAQRSSSSSPPSGGNNKAKQQGAGWFNSMLTGAAGNQRGRATNTKSPRPDNDAKLATTRRQPTTGQRANKSPLFNDRRHESSSSSAAPTDAGGGGGDDQGRRKRRPRAGEVSNSRASSSSRPKEAPERRRKQAPGVRQGAGHTSSSGIHQARELDHRALGAVRHEKEAHRFVLDLGDGKLARIDYRPLAGGGRKHQIELYHTEVPEELRGRGIGKALAKGALECAARADMKLRVSCEYLLDYLDRFADDKHRKLLTDAS